jgi:hypothetical protein
MVFLEKKHKDLFAINDQEAPQGYDALEWNGTTV